MTDFELHLTGEQYRELARHWHEYCSFGGLHKETFEPMDFVEWLNGDEYEEPYSLPTVEAFFAEKERREGTALPPQVLGAPTCKK